jgi:hypothetical protein
MAAAAGYPIVVRSHSGPAAAGVPDLGDRDRASDKASRAQRDDRCSLSGPLAAPPGHTRAFTCPAARSASDQSIRAKVSLATSATCAVISADVYRTTVCTDRVVVSLGTHTVAMSAVDPPAGPGAWHRIEIHTPGNAMTVTYDGENVIDRSRLNTPGRGAVSLGWGSGPGEVGFAEVEISSVG